MKTKRIHIFFTLILALMAAAATSSCNKDEVIEAGLKPTVGFDNSTGVYSVKSGRQITISPIYANVTAATYCWSEDGDILSENAVFTYTWREPGTHYLMLTVKTPVGSVTEELRIEVLETAPPTISLPLSGDELMLAVGDSYIFAPEIGNSDDDLTVEWSIDGKSVSNEPIYTYQASETGEFLLTVTATNGDGANSRTILIRVLDSLPYVLEFPTPSRLIESTARFTFPGRAVYLAPVIENLSSDGFTWTVNGAMAECSGPVFIFTPSEAGSYIVTVTASGGESASVTVVCVDATESGRRRSATASNASSFNKIYEWQPAPGQFIGDTTVGGMTETLSTHDEALAWAEKRMEIGGFVTLGGFGGYIIVGFDHSISSSGGDYDFSIGGNAFVNSAAATGSSNEPGIVYVMQDVNGNGLPDDEWYELRGSESGKASTLSDYAVTYFRPSGPNMNVQWRDNLGNTGTIDHIGLLHPQPYYYPAWIAEDSYTLRGTCLPAATSQDSETGLWNNAAFPWGYADNLGSDNLVSGSSSSPDGEGQKNGFKIANAMYPDGSPANLEYIDFIKVQTGVNSKSGFLGEVSTEVFSFRDLSMSRK